MELSDHGHEIKTCLGKRFLYKEKTTTDINPNCPWRYHRWTYYHFSSKLLDSMAYCYHGHNRFLLCTDGRKACGKMFTIFLKVTIFFERCLKNRNSSQDLLNVWAVMPFNITQTSKTVFSAGFATLDWWLHLQCFTIIKTIATRRVARGEQWGQLPPQFRK